MRLVRTVVALAWMLAIAAAAAAQATLSGRVTDAQNAAVVGATVTVTSAAGRKLQSTTSTEGTFAFSDVSAGVYTLQIDAAGFARWSQNVTVAASMAPLTIPLQVAGLSESISVVGTTPATLAI